jgi:pyruvate/2-oxoglutarate dehydrogenase complex dihydrolipoamide acyltransferase (E2) component
MTYIGARSHPPPGRDRAEGDEVRKTTRAEIKVSTIAGAAKLSIGRWFKRVGNPVGIGEPLVEIDTYNLTHEIRAPATGILAKIWVMDGESVEPGTVGSTIDQV